MSDLPEDIVDYLRTRDRQRGDRVGMVWIGLSERERGLVKDAAVMGWIQGSRSAHAGAGWPGDWVAVPTVIDACLDHPDLYPTISGYAAEQEWDRLNEEEGTTS